MTDKRRKFIRRKFTLEVSVEYLIPENPAGDRVTNDQIKSRLSAAAEHLADNGLLTGDLDIEVDGWYHAVRMT